MLQGEEDALGRDLDLACRAGRGLYLGDDCDGPLAIAGVEFAREVGKAHAEDQGAVRVLLEPALRHGANTGQGLLVQNDRPDSPYFPLAALRLFEQKRARAGQPLGDPVVLEQEPQQHRVDHHVQEVDLRILPRRDLHHVPVGVDQELLRGEAPVDHLGGGLQQLARLVEAGREPVGEAHQLEAKLRIGQLRPRAQQGPDAGQPLALASDVRAAVHGQQRGEGHGQQHTGSRRTHGPIGYHTGGLRRNGGCASAEDADVGRHRARRSMISKWFPAGYSAPSPRPWRGVPGIAARVPVAPAPCEPRRRAAAMGRLNLARFRGSICGGFLPNPRLNRGRAALARTS